MPATDNPAYLSYIPQKRRVAIAARRFCEPMCPLGIWVCVCG